MLGASFGDGAAPGDEHSQGAPTLRPPFDRLVGEGTLTVEQANAVLVALDAATVKAPDAAHRRPVLMTRLAEIGGYLGAALVVAAGVVVVAQQWADMTYGVRVAVMAGSAAVLLAAAVAILAFTHGPTWSEIPHGATVRRLCGVLFSLGAFAVFGTVMVAMLAGEGEATNTRISLAFVVAGLTASAVLVIARLRANIVLAELALFAASLSVVVGVIQLWFTDDLVAIQWTVLAVGLAWALVGTFTRLVQYHTVITSLGLTLALYGSATIAEEFWSQRLALAALMVVALAVYLFRPTWPYITAGTIAAVVLTVTWVGEAIGAAMALLAAGVVVLVLAGGALIAHNRRRSRGVPKGYNSCVRGGT